MHLETKDHKEFHPNGQVWITGQIGVIAPIWKHLYNFRLFDFEGNPTEAWCRLGKWTKHYDNGQLAWTMDYDEYGNYVKNDHPQFRKDGTTIVYNR